MGKQIIKQPNGLYCVFSSIVDHVIVYNATIDELIEDEVQEFRERITKGFHETAAQLDRGEKPYHQFTMDYQALIRTIKSHHGKDDETLKAFIEAANSKEDI